MKKILITEKQLENLKKNSNALTEEVKRFRRLVEQDNSNPWKGSDFHDNANTGMGFQGTGFENQDNQGNQPIRDDELGVVDALKFVLQNMDNNTGDQEGLANTQMGLVSSILFNSEGKVRFSTSELENMIQNPNGEEQPDQQDPMDQQAPPAESDQYPQGNQDY